MKDIIYCGMYKIGLVCHFPHNNHFVIDHNAAWSNALLHQANDEDQQYTVETGDKQQSDNSQKNETYHKQTEYTGMEIQPCNFQGVIITPLVGLI